MPDDCWINEETERRLLANDPTVTSVEFQKSHRQNNPQADDLERMVKALGQSTHVTKLSLSFNFLDDIVEDGLSTGSKEFESLKQLCLWIKSNPKLDTVHLNSYFRSRETSAALMPAFVAAICARCRYLKSVALDSVEIKADDLARLFGESDLLQEFSMKACVIRRGSFATEEMAARKVAESLTAMQVLSTLELGVTNWNQDCFVAILEQIQSHTSLEALKFCNHTPNLPIWALNAIANLLQNASDKGHWRELHFDSFDWTDVTMGPIACSICASSMPLQELYFYRGSLDNASMVHLQSLFSPDSLMRTVWFEGFMFTFADDVAPDSLEALMSASSSLNDIGLPGLGSDKQGRKLFRAALRGLKAASCGIRKLYFLDSLGEDNLTALVDAIPYFTSVTNIYFGNSFTGRKDKLLNAFCRNRKLVASNIKFFDEFDASEHSRLEAYMERNRSLGPIIQSTVKSMGVLEHDEKDDSVGSTVTDHGNGSLLPTLFGRPDCSLMTEPTLVFRALVQLEEEVGPEETVGSKRCAVTESPTNVSSKRLKREMSIQEASEP